MPIINIHGGNGPKGPASGSGPRTGPSSQIPFMRPDYDKAWNSNAPSGPGKDDYARAQAQKDAQERRAAAADRQKQSQQDADFRRSQQQAQAAQRIFERTTREEVRVYETAQRAKAKADADLQRARERNARAQEQLDRRQAADRATAMRFQRGLEVGDARAMDSTRTRRLREEARLGQQFSNLQYRAGRPLTASGYDGIQRQAALLRGRASAYQGQHGMSPSGLGGMGAMLGGMGSRENTYATQNILSLGGRGQRAAEGREWVGLARIEQELRRIEKINQAMLANGTKATAEQKANAQRNLGALRDARGRIGAGRSGNSGLRNMVGDAIGGAGMLLSNPLVDIAGAAAIGLATEPFIASSAANSALSMSDKYYSLQERTMALGRAGGFKGQGLADRLLPRSGGIPGWMSETGMTMGRAAAIQGAYGIAPRSAAAGEGLLKDVGYAAMLPGMGLSDQQLAGSAGLARTLGVTGLGAGAGGFTGSKFGGTMTATSENTKYFQTLQKVMASATAQGLDQATSLKNVEGLLRITAGSGAASVNAGGLSRFWGQMTSSGLPGMRSGEGVASALSGINQAFGSIGVGGGPAQNTMMMTYFAKHGGMPKTEGALQKMLGMSDEDWAAEQAKPGHAQMVKNYLDTAGKSPAIALNYLSPLLQGHPELMKNFFEGSAFGGLNSTIKPLVGGIVTGAGYGGYVGMTSGNPNMIDDAGTRIGMVSVRDRLAKDLGLSSDAAAGIAGNFMAESGGKAGVTEAGGGSGRGLAQWTGARRTAYDAFRKAHPDLDAGEADIQFAESELGPGGAYAGVTKQLQAPGMSYDRASDIVISQYENPRNQSAAEKARRQGMSGEIAYGASASDNIPTDANRARTAADQLDYNASRYGADTVGKALGAAGDTAVRFSQGMDRAAVSLDHFIMMLDHGAAALGRTQVARPSAGGTMPFMSPEGMPLQQFNLGPQRP